MDITMKEYKISPNLRLHRSINHHFYCGFSGTYMHPF
jgi:hypothetical protein